MSDRRHVTIRVEGGETDSALGTLGCFGAFLLMGAAWATHVFWVIGKLAGSAGVTGGQLLLGFMGSAFPPVGVIHGVMIWFGKGMG